MAEKLLSKIGILACGGFFLIFIDLWLLTISEVRSGDETMLLTPLGKNLRIGSPPDPLFEKIMSAKTTDNYPPNSHFPTSFVPRFRDNIDIIVSSYAVMDRDTKELLYGKNITKEYPIASITKVMTAIIALENSPLDLEIQVSSASARIGEASMGISSGERFTVNDLLYGVLLPSGNDAAETLAEGVGMHKKNIPANQVDGGGARKWFIDEMNKKAQALGMFDSFFVNPTGLDEETAGSSSFSTSLDLLAFADYALENKTFAEIANTRYINLPYLENYHKALYIENILQLGKSYDGIKGIKPGNSIFAKETLLSYAERDGRKIIVVILGSDHTKDDVLKIYNRVFGK